MKTSYDMAGKPKLHCLPLALAIFTKDHAGSDNASLTNRFALCALKMQSMYRNSHPISSHPLKIHPVIPTPSSMHVSSSDVKIRPYIHQDPARKFISI